MASHDAELVVDIKNVHVQPDRSALVGCSIDEKTRYVFKLSRDEFCEMLERLAPLAEGRCPRCDFEEALSVVCYAGEYIRGHFASDAQGQLSPSEVKLLELAQAWAADDAITRCLNGDAEREH